MKRAFIRFCLSILLIPALAGAAEDALLGEAELAARLDKTPDYQLLDARSAEAQRAAPLAFSTRYQPMMPFRKGLVLVVADSDAAAAVIARAIPGDPARSVYAVKGGADAWRRIAEKAAPPTALPDKFVIPMNTCEQGKPLQVLKRDKPRTQSGTQPKTPPAKK